MENIGNDRKRGKKIGNFQKTFPSNNDRRALVIEPAQSRWQMLAQLTRCSYFSHIKMKCKSSHSWRYRAPTVYSSNCPLAQVRKQFAKAFSSLTRLGSSASRNDIELHKFHLFRSLRNCFFVWTGRAARGIERNHIKLHAHCTSSNPSQLRLHYRMAEAWIVFFMNG